MNKHFDRFWHDLGVSPDDTDLLAAIECLPQPAWVFDRDGRYIAQSRIDRETHGDLIGKLPTEAQVGPEAGRRWLAFHRRVINGEHFHHMREMMTPRGLIHSETAVSPLVKNGKIVGGIGVSVDQTKRVAAEAAQHKGPGPSGSAFFEFPRTGPGKQTISTALPLSSATRSVWGSTSTAGLAGPAGS